MNRSPFSILTPKVMRVLLLSFLASIFFHIPSSVAGEDNKKHDQDSETIPLTIISTSDVHGWLAPHQSELKDGRILETGGLATLSGYLPILWDEFDGRVVLLDAGDMFQGTFLSNSQYGKPIVEAMNMLGYHAATIGNHEFDYGPASDGPEDDMFGALKQTMKEATFPFLTSNILDRKTGLPPVWPNTRPNTMINMGGIMVGVVGAITLETKSAARSDVVRNLKFEDKTASVIKQARELRAKGAQIVVGLVHSGSGCKSFKNTEDTATCDSDAAIFRMARELPHGLVDVLIGGHTHQKVAHMVSDVAIIQGPALAQGFGRVDFFVDKKTGKVVREKTVVHSPQYLCTKQFAKGGHCNPWSGKGKLVPATYMGEKVELVPAVALMAQQHQDRVAAIYYRRLGKGAITEDITRERFYSSPLGNLITDIILETVPGADVVIQNSGGLRADLAKGPVTYGKIYDILPFDNKLAMVTMSGSDLKEFIRQATVASMMQISGVRAKIDQSLRNCKGKDPLLSLTLADGKTPVDDKAMYNVVMSDFLATGTEGYARIFRALPKENVKILKDAPNHRETVVSWFEKREEPISTPKDKRGNKWILDRIEIINADAEKACN